MRIPLTAAVGRLLLGLASAGMVAGGTNDFQDPFRQELGAGWTWIREDPAAWRIGEEGLEIRVQPGNMWGGANDARNVLTRPVPDPRQGEVTVAVRLHHRPTEQYEQVDLVWYYSDSHMVKIGQELVDGSLSVVMGREEGDRTRTIAIIPIPHETLEVRFVARGDIVEGSFRPPGAGPWQVAGSCSLPVQGSPKISLQCYQGPAERASWARLADFQLTVREADSDR